jgi:beta-lactam-binding protein with PASTA domain
MSIEIPGVVKKIAGRFPRERLNAAADRVLAYLSDFAHRRPGVSWVFILLFVLLVVFSVFLGIVDALVHTRKEVVMPDLTGKTLDEAKKTLNGAKMALGPVAGKFDESAPAGTVLGQAPRSGNPVKHGTPVGLTVSRGPHPIPVPDVRGQEQGAAVDALEAAGLKAAVSPEPVNDPKVPEGSVVAQDPASGNLTRGGSVTLIISKGPKLIHVPSFIGKQASEAQKALKDLGFKVQVDNILGGFFGTVRAQDPVDTNVPEGSVITITVV